MMSGKKIIIDGLYKDDTTVVLYKDGQIEELRHQNATQNFIKGNIYLAKIEKIEPALQAAFVNYGQGKSGFLQFSEIHPKYFGSSKFESSSKSTDVKEIKIDQTIEDENQVIKQIHKQLVSVPTTKPVQSFIKVDQTILVQIEKDERGTKGASLTTYLSLSGRYCVLLLNSTKANIVSKFVEDEDERQRLKDIASELCMLHGDISIMLKPNAAYKTKIEITRDFGYLMRLWNNIQKHIEKGEAPLFIHEEGDVIKKSIRDLYDGEVSEIVVSGEEAYQNALSFMKLLMPKYISKVKYHEGPNPIFIEYDIHHQVKELYGETVSLISGGYLVINQTEALTSIDVNSGRAKSEDSVEDTAVKINLEAAHEVVKQIKLRNISGLIVVDFIDMLSQESRETIEKIVRDGLANQTTKSIVTKMSEFALLEISRQRLGNSLNECVFHRCKECNGKGRVRAFELTSVAILKAICEEVFMMSEKDLEDDIVIEVGARREVIMEIINNRKKELFQIEDNYDVKVKLKIDESATLDTFFIERKKLKRMNKVALSTIDKTHYIDNDRPRKDIQHKKNLLKQKSNKVTNHITTEHVKIQKKSLIKRIFESFWK